MSVPKKPTTKPTIPELDLKKLEQLKQDFLNQTACRPTYSGYELEDAKAFFEEQDAVDKRVCDYKIDYSFVLKNTIDYFEHPYMSPDDFYQILMMLIGSCFSRVLDSASDETKEIYDRIDPYQKIRYIEDVTEDGKKTYSYEKPVCSEVLMGCLPNAFLGEMWESSLRFRIIESNDKIRKELLASIKENDPEIYKGIQKKDLEDVADFCVEENEKQYFEVICDILTKDYEHFRTSYDGLHDILKDIMDDAITMTVDNDCEFKRPEEFKEYRKKIEEIYHSESDNEETKLVYQSLYKGMHKCLMSFGKLEIPFLNMINQYSEPMSYYLDEIAEYFYMYQYKPEDLNSDMINTAICGYILMDYIELLELDTEERNFTKMELEKQKKLANNFRSQYQKAKDENKRLRKAETRFKQKEDAYKREIESAKPLRKEISALKTKLSRNQKKKDWQSKKLKEQEEIIGKQQEEIASLRALLAKYEPEEKEEEIKEEPKEEVTVQTDWEEIERNYQEITKKKEIFFLCAGSNMVNRFTSECPELTIIDISNDRFNRHLFSKCEYVIYSTLSAHSSMQKVGSIQEKNGFKILYFNQQNVGQLKKFITEYIRD